MNKTALILFLLIPLTIRPGMADYNPLFGEHKHQIALHIGTGVNSGFLIPSPTQFVPFAMLHFQYSIPTTFFRKPARQSLNLAQTIGYANKHGWNWSDYTIRIAFLSEDITLWQNKKNDWYFGTGIGFGMQTQQNNRISSKLIFGFKMFAGHKVSDNTNIELFMQHFSNGNTTPENHSYAFYGLGLVHNF